LLINNHFKIPLIFLYIEKLSGILAIRCFSRPGGRFVNFFSGGKTMKTRLALTFFGIFLASNVSLGVTDYCLRLVGQSQGPILGECPKKTSHYSIVVYAYSQNLVSQVNETTGLPTGKRQNQPLTITKAVDRATPKLMTAWATGEKMSGFVLEFFQTDTGRDLLYYCIMLTDAQIIGIKQYTPLILLAENSVYKDMEEVTFVYSTLTCTYNNITNPAETTTIGWQPAAIPLVSDLNNDGTVNLADLAILASEWLKTVNP
jgi:type VI secretion system secreted protein Hcp